MSGVCATRAVSSRFRDAQPRAWARPGAAFVGDAPKKQKASKLQLKRLDSGLVVAKGGWQWLGNGQGGLGIGQRGLGSGQKGLGSGLVVASIGLEVAW